MASYAALVSLMQVIRDLEHHPSPPISLDKQLLDSITQHIIYLQEFLQSYNRPPSDEEEAADPLEMRIAEAAYAAEDAIEYHIVDCFQLEGNENANDEKTKSNNKCFGILQSVIEEMDSIKKVILEAVDTKTKKKSPEVVVHDQVAMPDVTRSETMVGSDIVVLEIMEKLAGGQLDCQVIPIVGMGGIGKTFLAKTIYAKPFIKEHFDICAWVTISQHYDTKQILCELLSQATKVQQSSGKSVDELGLELHKYLFCRRFLIMMDDMWSIDSWDKIQHFFPNNGNGSRVLVTTRLSQLSSQLNSINDYSLQMSFLNKASSWELFSKTVFGEKSSCPSELEEIGKKIVVSCRGLPLSIAVVGGLLKKMAGTRESWESIRDNFNSVVNMDNDKHCLRLLKLSYIHLPVYLKPCFLYMGAFEEDEEVRVSTLVQLWISEGFLKLTEGEALETTARGFLQDLIDRNLILIGELGAAGSFRFCKIHDLVRDMCLNECQKEGFFHVVGKCIPPSPHSQRRRVVIPEYTSEEIIIGELRFMSHTRSIICERRNVASFQNMVLLRTLQAYNKSASACNQIHLYSVLFRCVNIRHLAVKALRISSGFPSLSHLWNLHTLIVSYSLTFSSVPVADFWKMPRITHFEFDCSYACLPDPPNCDGDVVMENLHTLKRVRNFKCSEGVLQRIPNVKRLKLEYNNCYNGYVVYFLENLKYLCALESLSIDFYPLSPIDPPREITFPHSLKKLSLCMKSDFEWDDILEKISSLAVLEKLKLSLGCFRNKEWEIAQRQFPCLKYLKLELYRGLISWTAAEEDSSILPRLEHLDLIGLRELKKIPSELGNIDTLKSIKLSFCGDELVSSVKEMFDEQVELQGGEDQLSFHVVLNVRKKQQHLMSLAGPKFYVHLEV